MMFPLGATMFGVAEQQAQDNIVFIDGNIANNYVAKDVEEARSEMMEDHLVTDNETLNTGP